MKKYVFIAICVLGICCFSSCRSTTHTCGLADNISIENSLNQTDLI